LIVLDNSVISAFCEIGRFGLLGEVLSNLDVETVVPHTVEEEIIFEDAINALSKGEITEGRWIKVIVVEDYERYLEKLHGGEAGVIALAKDRNAVALIDDLDARKIAEGEGVRVSGTLGIIKVGYELCPIKTRDELRSILRDLKRVHFRMNREIEKEILDTEKKRRFR
jgi:predicted nucleic acid-binding protein